MTNGYFDSTGQSYDFEVLLGLVSDLINDVAHRSYCDERKQNSLKPGSCLQARENPGLSHLDPAER